MESPGSLHLYNTLSQRKEAFEPIRKGEVRMYVCGPTVYDACHLGHARSYVVFDVVARYLRSLGFKVRVAINFTDVDDRITQRASRVGQDPLSFAEAKIADFFADMDALGIARADRYLRASRYVPEMIKVVERLLNCGFAYRAGGKILFDVEKAGGYGSLLHARPEDSVVHEAGKMDASRKASFDFELWDGTIETEPLWNSPWGKGRIGWHVECYTMSRILGHPLDITGGGVDLIFPHHESKRLIALALGKDLSRFYVHNAFLTLSAGKMAKSKGVYITIREALRSYRPESIRFFLLGTHYRQNMAFSEGALSDASKQLQEVRDLANRLKETSGGPGPQDGQLLRLVRELNKKFSRSMNDDLDTPKALQALSHFASEASDLSIGSQAAEKALRSLGYIGDVLGFKWA